MLCFGFALLICFGFIACLVPFVVWLIACGVCLLGVVCVVVYGYFACLV